MDDNTCVFVTSPETGQTYRVQMAERVDLTDEDRRDLALWMDAVAAAARKKLADQ